MSLGPRHSVRGSRATIVGAARSGMAAARLLNAYGSRVFVTESGRMSAEDENELRDLGVAYEFGGHTSTGLDADFLVTSPGVPPGASLLVQARENETPVYSEIEVASWFCTAPVIGITGSNGKTTTTSLTGHVLSQSGRKTWVAGNIGLPFAAIVDRVSAEDVVVLEVSSFQLEHTATFRPRISILLNITPDHLDRYGGSMSRYAAAKYRLCAYQGQGDTLIYNLDDPLLEDLAYRTPELDRLGISLEKTTAAGYVRDDTIHLCLDGKDEPLMETEQLALRGKHNLYNSLAAAVAARVMEVRSDVVRESLATFEGVPHRLEPVREVQGVRYINDSKATNVNAVWYALESMRDPVILLAGGRDKGNDYGPLRPLVSQKVKSLVCFGEAAGVIAEAVGDAAGRSLRARDLEEALELASAEAQSGDVVLLSPACASFDQFDNYEQRGNAFKRLVNNL
ncbi:MAG: UDP-N-acetylmuramoyl-L-alanine--D-glutamate ligase [Rhodothermales bacterium]|nr:UDP-N-acetylmuramoyl-L-alanine--D-glutamate ligase [Rhodothermales bacterium]